MRKIEKGREPSVLIKYRAQPHCTYDSLTVSDDRIVRDALYDEQRGICCYCMCRIKRSVVDKPPVTKIEHFKCQTNHPDLDRTYSNTLLACEGGMGNPKKKQHCDTAKGDLTLSRNPADSVPDINTLIHYKTDGVVYSKDAGLNSEIKDVLNLNRIKLINYRKDVIVAFQAFIDKQGKQQKKSFFQNELKRWRGELDGNPLKPYCGVVIYYLEKKIRRM